MITFSIDTFPLSHNIAESNDYSSKIIFSAVCDTLFKYNLSKNEIEKNACDSYEYTKDRKNLIIKIRDDLYFYNSNKVTAIDYCNTFKEILSSNTHIGVIFRNFFSDVKLIDKMTFQLTNKSKNIESYKILSIYSTSCVKENYTSGPYYIKELKDNYILLERNKFYRKKMHNKSSSKLKFILTDGLDDYNLFINNKVQITNNTLCDVNKIDKYNYIQEENYIYLNLAFSLELMNKKFKSLRYNINNVIDRTKILNLLKYKHNANYSFIVNNNSSKNVLKRKKVKINFKTNNKKVLTLGYNDFYPNKEIALEIKQQLEKVGFTIRLIENTFNIKNTSDINIVLNHLEYISPDSMINGSYFSLMLQKSFIYKTILKLYNKTHNEYLLNIINKKILKLNFKIPILKMNSYYLKKDVYKYFNYIELNFEEL